MRILKSTLVAGLISIFVSFSSFAEKVKIGDPGWTGATAIANLLAAVVTNPFRAWLCAILLAA